MRTLDRIHVCALQEKKLGQSPPLSRIEDLALREKLRDDEYGASCLVRVTRRRRHP